MEVGVRIVGIILRLLDFLLAPLFWLKGRRRRTVPPIRNPLLMRSAKQLAEAIRNGEFTSEEITTIYIDRVKEVNPYLNAVVDERYRAALEEAKSVDRQIDEARKSGTLDELVRGKPLLGVPFTVKESCSLGGMSNSVGVVEEAGSRAARDGRCVKRVRNAGAIPLLVTSTPELCLGWETTNLIRGATNNPYHLGKTPGGSSGGEAALLACGASAFSVGSDIAGSIRLPAAFCGVFGHKPTPGIISIEDHIPTVTDPQFPKFLTVGPMARKAEDLPLLMQVLADHTEHLRLDEPVDMRDVKVVYMTEAGSSPALLPVERCIAAAVRRAVSYLGSCGCHVSEEKFPELEDSVEISLSVFFSMKGIPNMLHDPANPKVERSLWGEMARHAVCGARRSMQALIFELIHRTKLFIPGERTEHYHGQAERLRERIKEVLGNNGVLIYPVFNELAYYHNQVFLKASGVMYTMVFNILGVPATAVPVASDSARQLPIAIQVIAAPYQDRLCLAVARQLEEGFGGWKPPN